MISLSWARATQDDFQEIYLKALEDDAGFAGRLATLIQKANDLLIDFRNIGTALGDAALRKWKVAKTPYWLIYRIDAESLEVLRVYHEEQDWRTVP